MTSLHNNFHIIGRVEAVLPSVQHPLAPTLVVFLLDLQEHLTWNNTGMETDMILDDKLETLNWQKEL
jgi:hypothetical protein